MAKRARQEENTKAKSIVKINAGGKIYYTTEKTLTANFPDSMIARLFTHKEMIERDDEGIYFLDVDPTLFGAMLNVMRRPSLVEVVPKGVAEETWWYELDYWGIREYSEMTVELKESPVSTTTKEPEMPAAFALKLQLLQEKRVEMAKQTLQYDMLILDKVLEWVNIDHILLSRTCTLNTGFWMPPSLVYLDPLTQTFGPKIPHTTSICVSGYIWYYAHSLTLLLKEKTSFKTVVIEMKVPAGPYRFLGVQYEVVPNTPVLHIIIQHDYHRSGFISSVQ